MLDLKTRINLEKKINFCQYQVIWVQWIGLNTVLEKVLAWFAYL